MSQQDAVPAAVPATEQAVTQAKFCRHCGTQLASGARFCRHCGAAIGVPPTGAPGTAAPHLAGPAWPSRGAAGSGRGGFSHLPPLGKLTAVFVPLVLLGILIVAVLPGPPRCVYACGTPTGPVLPAGQTYANRLGYTFQYPSHMSIGKPALGDDVTVDDPAGQMLIWAGKGGQSPSSLVQTYAQKLSNGAMQDVKSFGAVPGAEIGFVPGDGEFYSAQFQQQNGQDLPVGLAVMAARSGGTWAVAVVWAVCVDPADGQPQTCSNQFFRGGGVFANGSDFDDVLARWHWPGS